MIYFSKEINTFSSVDFAPCFKSEVEKESNFKFILDSESTEKLKNFSGRTNIDEFIVLQLFWNMAVSRMTSETEILFGVKKGVQDNVLPFVYEYEGGNIEEQLRSYSSCLSRVYDDNEACDDNFSWENMSYSFGKSQCDVEIEIYCDEKYCLAINCKNGKYTIDAIKKTVGLMDVLLKHFLNGESSNADGLKNLTSAEEAVIEENMNDFMTGYEYRNVNIISLFKEYAEKSPNKKALIFYSKRITYKELDELSDKLAFKLLSSGIGNRAHIAIDTTPSPEAVIAMLAAIKTGGCYIPLDIRLPEERIKSILRDVHADVVILNRNNSLSIDIHTIIVDADELRNAVSPKDFVTAERNDDTTFYIMFTSGTTSKPKGIAVPDGGVISLVKSGDCCKFNELSYMFQVSTMAFDVSTFEIWGALLNGTTLVMIDKKLLMSPGALEKFAMMYRNNAICLTTSIFNNFVDMEYELFRYTDYVIVAGEKFSAAHGEKFLKMFSDKTLINAYGPTENSVYSTYYTLEKEEMYNGQVPIGKPLKYRGALICDTACSPLPDGAMGEIVVYGSGVALGYYNDIELTNRYFYNIKPDVKAYKTGDFGYVDEKGMICYISRKDLQLKIRGNRINITEIEQALLEIGNIVNAAVLPEIITQNDIKLHGYIVERERTGFDENIKRNISAELGKKLPPYMIPSEYFRVPNIPLSSNGKMDKAKLKDYAASLTK